MELDRFIENALLDIVRGVQAAQRQTDKGTIVPPIATVPDAVKAGLTALQSVEFDVVIRVDDQKGSEAKISVLAGWMGGSVAGNSSQGSGNETRMRFKVPVQLPMSGDANTKLFKRT
ncbi:MAG: hypothetical protein ABJZ55_01910 [Fuerstiella sp.]